MQQTVVLYCLASMVLLLSALIWLHALRTPIHLVVPACLFLVLPALLVIRLVLVLRIPMEVSWAGPLHLLAVSDDSAMFVISNESYMITLQAQI